MIQRKKESAAKIENSFDIAQTVFILNAGTRIENWDSKADVATTRWEYQKAPWDASKQRRR